MLCCHLDRLLFDLHCNLLHQAVIFIAKNYFEREKWKC